jgi:hypothetical protein
VAERSNVRERLCRPRRGTPRALSTSAVWREILRRRLLEFQFDVQNSSWQLAAVRLAD